MDCEYDEATIDRAYLMLNDTDAMRKKINIQLPLAYERVRGLRAESKFGSRSKELRAQKAYEYTKADLANVLAAAVL